MKTKSSRFVAIIATAFLAVSLLPSTNAYAAAPKNVAAPQISGIPRIGATLTGAHGTWDASPTPTVTSSWFRCDKAIAKPTSTQPSGCSAIPGATSTSFVPTSAQKGKFISFSVTQTNTLGSASRWSPSTIAITAAPVNTVAPEIQGSAGIGTTLTVNVGTWVGTPAPTFKYAWHRCTSKVASAQVALAAGCTAIKNATSATFKLTASDNAKFVLVKLTASNSGGSAIIHTASTDAVGTPPTYTVAPSVSGTPEVGVTLTGLPGTWTSTTDTSRTVYWLACASAITKVQVTWPTNCTETENYSYSFTPVAAHAGRFITFGVREYNSAGETLAFSISTSAVKSPPVNLVEPTVSGIPVVGQTLTGITGTWVASPSASVTRTWLQCWRPIENAIKNPSSNSPDLELLMGCGPISGATKDTLQLTESLAGRYIARREIAKNSAGESLAVSKTVKVGFAEGLIEDVPASIQTVQNHLYQLRARSGTWHGFPKPSTTFTWYSCEGATAPSDSLPEGCNAIPGATSNFFSANMISPEAHLVLKTKASNGLEAKIRYSKSFQFRLRTIIQSGANHYCSLSASGTVKCWGDNEYGQLGNGNRNPTPFRQNVELPGKAMYLSAGDDHTCAFVIGAGLMCWGRNDSGQLGNGRTTDALRPTKVLGQASGLVNISAGPTNTCGISWRGEVYCWGSNRFGQSGSSLYGNASVVTTPLFIVENLPPAQAVSVGRNHACALLVDGQMKCWGLNSSMQTGFNGAQDISTYTNNSPVYVQVPDDSPRAVEMTSGDDHTCAILESERVVCWGASDWGQAGGTDFGDMRLPRYVGTSTNGAFANAVHISSGAVHNCVSTSDGQVMCWGANNYAQLGVGKAPNSDIKELTGPLASPVESGVSEVEAGGGRSCYANETGGVYCWGDYGIKRIFWDNLNPVPFAFRIEDNRGHINPVKVDQSVANAIDVSVFENSACALTSSGDVYCWGPLTTMSGDQSFWAQEYAVPRHQGNIANAANVTLAYSRLGGVVIYVRDDIGTLRCLNYELQLCDAEFEISDVVDFGWTEMNEVIALKSDGTSWEIGDSSNPVQMDLPILDNLGSSSFGDRVDTVTARDGVQYFMGPNNTWFGDLWVSTGHRGLGLPNLQSSVKRLFTESDWACALLFDKTLWCWRSDLSPVQVGSGIKDLSHNPWLVLAEPLNSLDWTLFGRSNETYGNAGFSSDAGMLDFAIAGFGASTDGKSPGWAQDGTNRLYGYVNYSRFSASYQNACWIPSEEKKSGTVECVGQGVVAGSPNQNMFAFDPIPIF